MCAIGSLQLAQGGCVSQVAAPDSTAILPPSLSVLPQFCFHFTCSFLPAATPAPGCPGPHALSTQGQAPGPTEHPALPGRAARSCPRELCPAAGGQAVEHPLAIPRWCFALHNLARGRLPSSHLCHVPQASPCRHLWILGQAEQGELGHKAHNVTRQDHEAEEDSLSSSWSRVPTVKPRWRQ